MKKSACLVSMLVLFAVSSVWAAPWAVIANYNDRTINTIDVSTGTVYGPFLSGQLDSLGWLLDVEMVGAEGRFALVSNYRQGMVYYIDLLDPTNPILADSVSIEFVVEDIAVAKNSNFALVTDGSVRKDIAIIDLSTFTSTTYTLQNNVAIAATAVAIAPDNQTVIVCDVNSSSITYFTVNPETGIPNSPEKTLLTGGSKPRDVAISPDGVTVLVTNYEGGVSVFKITSPGMVVPAEVTPLVEGTPEARQSIAFSPNGEKAYFVAQEPSPDQLVELNILDPDEVTFSGRTASLLSDEPADGSAFLGVEVVSVSPDGQYAVVGNPSSTGIQSPNVALVDLTTMNVSALYTESNFPVGTAFLPVSEIFKDVPLNFWASSYIESIYKSGITTGYGSGNYRPFDNVTRAQMAVFLERVKHGSDFAPPAASGIFEDVPIDYWAADWIELFYQDGLTKGCSTNPLQFCPDQPVTRAEMAIFLLRAEHGSSYLPPTAVGIFSDVSPGYWGADWIEQLYAEGITTGCSDNPLMFCPDDLATRAQAAAFLVRMFNME